MIFTHLVFFEFFPGASDSGSPPTPVDRVVNAPFLVNVGTLLNR